MRLSEFIKLHRHEIDICINSVIGHVPKTASCYCPLSGTDHQHAQDYKLNDKERREWIMSDEELYRWARSEGVKI